MIRPFENIPNDNIPISKSVQNNEPIVSYEEKFHKKKQEAQSKSILSTVFIPIQYSETNEFYAHKSNEYTILSGSTNNGIFIYSVSGSHTNSDKSYFQILRNNYSSSNRKPYFYKHRLDSTKGGIFISLPFNLIGESIQNNSVSVTIDTVAYDISLYDDGHGNLSNSSSTLTGSIFYEAGVIYIPQDITNGLYWDDFTTGDSIILSYKSTIPIREKIWNCEIPAGQLNNSLNKTSYIWSGSATGSRILNNSGSSFQPYVTTVGLYNEKHELMAVAKLAKPLKKSKNENLTLKIRIDM